MKKFLSVLTVAAFLATAPMSFACDGPECSGSGNFDIDTFAVGGGLDADGALIPNGAAGGISGAGGIAAGQAQGAFESGKIWKWVIPYGGADADLTTTAGGFTNTDAGEYKPDCGKNIGVYSGSENFATVGGELELGAWGLAYSEGTIGGIAGQASLDGSIVGPSPLRQWDSVGVSAGVAGQGSVGGFIGGGITAGLGSVDIEADVDMYGGSYTESYRGIKGNTEYMGTNVSAYTTVITNGDVDTRLIGIGFLEGGYIAAGGVASMTVQATDSGFAKATAVGSYAGSGELNCTFNGQANGYTYTSATTMPGMNGSVMSSSAGMKVSNSQIQTKQDPR